jgi:GNAT superfamily N-acetyltransferase
MPKQVTYRPYSSGDEFAILDLFQQSFSKKMTMKSWKWRFMENPAGQKAIELAWDEGKLVAHYAVSPVILSIKGKDCLTALSMTTMTHPSYRGHGLFPVLSNRLYERLKQRGYLMVWGFPNSQSHRTFITYLAWKDIYDIPMFHLDLDKLPGKPEMSERIIELTEFDKRFDELWTEVGSAYDVIVKCDQKYLNWRYAQNPLHKYYILAYTDNDEVLGYVVFKEYNLDIDIVDILTVRDNKIGEQLVSAVLDIARQRGDIKGINMWLSVHHSLHHQLERLGFINSAPVTYFGARSLTSYGSYGGMLQSFSSWHIQMGNSDVY